MVTYCHMNATRLYLTFWDNWISFDLKSTGKNAQFKIELKFEVEVILFSFIKEKKKKFEYKMASPAKRPKWRYDFVAFTLQNVST